MLKRLIGWLLVTSFVFVQSLSADMLFYYSAAILPSVIASNNTVDPDDEPPRAGGYPTTETLYAGTRLWREVLLSDDEGVVHCEWRNEAGALLLQSDINPPEQYTGGGECDIDFYFPAAGTFHYILTVTDTSGQTATNELNVTVLANDIPQVDIVNENQEVIQGTTLDFNATIIDDDSTSFMWYITKPDGSIQMEDQPFFPMSYRFDMPGQYTLKLEVIDAHQVKAFDSVEITVVADTVLPSITLNGDAEITLQVGSAYEELGASASDNVDGVLAVNISGTVDASTTGTYIVTYTAIDGSGNQVSVTRTVAVVDSIAPVIQLNGNDAITIMLNGSYQEEGATCSDNYDNSCAVVISGTVDTSKAGTYIISYDAVDQAGNNAVQVTRTVHVKEVKITLLGDNPYEHRYDYTFTDPGAEVNFGSLTIDVDDSAFTTNYSQLELKRYELLYEAKDTNGNVLATAIRYVDVVDKVAPVLSLVGPQVEYLKVGDTYNDQGVECTDAFDSVCNTWIVSSDVDMSTSGTYTVVYGGEDSSKNQAQEITRTVSVKLEIHTVDDTVDPEQVEAVTVDVLKNDQYEGTVSIEFFLGFDPDTFVELYDTNVVTEKGTWSIENNIVTFTPSDTFGGGTVSIQYAINRLVGKEATLTINYPGGSDTTPPVITVLGENPYSILLGSSYQDPGVAALDDIDGTVSVDINTSGLDTSTVGRYTVLYRAVDGNGNESTASRIVDVVENVSLQAVGDHIQNLTDIEMQTIAVTNNDQVPYNASIESVTLKIWNLKTDSYEYLTEFTSDQGIWTVIGQTVEFTPNSQFNGGTVYIEYRIVDTNGAHSDGYIQIDYPTVIYAKPDYVSVTDFASVSVDVLANDTNTSAVTVKLQDYDANYNQVWIENVSVAEGDWSVVDGMVVFEPNPTFAGGDVYIQYQIEDTVGNIATSGITISYPIILQANYDSNVSASIQTVVVPVTDNDVIVSGLSTVSLILYDNNGDIQPTTELIYSTGIWSVEGESISFSPADGFLGGTVYASYQLKDVDGKTASSGIEITFPLLSSPVCEATSLNSIESVYTTIAGEIDFRTKPAEWSSNGLRHYTADLDTEQFVIDTSVYEGITGSTPDSLFYDLEVEEYIGDEIFVDSGRASFDNNSMQWTYHEEEIGNDNGRKYLVSSDEVGSYVQNGNELVIDNETGLKFVRDIDANEMEIMLNDGNITITLDAEDTAKLMFERPTKDIYAWYESITKISNPYGSLIEYVESNEYNNSFAGYVNGVLSNQNGDRKIVFASGASGNSGTLVEVRANTNEMLLTDAGIWTVKSIVDNGVTYDILFVETSLCGYESSIFRLNQDGQVVRGEFRENRNEVNAEIVYSESLYNKLKQYFIDHSTFDISAPYAPSITEDMILSKTFYLEPSVNGKNGNITYGSLLFSSSDVMEYKGIETDAQGIEVGTSSQQYDYDLGQGMIDLYSEYGQFGFKLISEESTLWNMQDDSGVDQVWLFNPPANYPNP